jgi:hypothetical protein
MSKDAVFIFHGSLQGIDVHIHVVKNASTNWRGFFFLLFSKIIFYSIRLISDWSLEQLIRIPFCNLLQFHLFKKKKKTVDESRYIIDTWVFSCDN